MSFVHVDPHVHWYPPDLCGALISQDLTLIPVSHWASNIDFASDIKLFAESSKGFDTYANYAVFLCANCVAYLHDHHTWSRESQTARWEELICLLEKWYMQRSEEMKPILTIPATEAAGQSPFPIVLYGNGPAGQKSNRTILITFSWWISVSGNQLYHTAILLMLQGKPRWLNPQRRQKSIFWHARQICAISESNAHQYVIFLVVLLLSMVSGLTSSSGAWTNSIQPIWIAGKVMSHPSEHRAILNIYERIERETGWVTSWRRNDLKAWWGDNDEW